MIAGSLALLEAPVADPLDSAGEGFTTLDVRSEQTYLDGSTVQQGRACAHGEGTTEEIHIVDGTTIEVEQVGTKERVWTDWVADVTDAGFVVAERTHGDDPQFPFDVIRAATGVAVEPAMFDPAAFVRQQDDIDLWFSGSKYETGENKPNDVSMGYGQDANSAGGNVGVGFETTWNGTVAKGVLYESGYVSIYNESWSPAMFAQFVRDALLPIANVPDQDDIAEQQTLGEEECDACGRESDDIHTVGDEALCVVCADRREEVSA